MHVLLVYLPVFLSSFLFLFVVSCRYCVLCYFAFGLSSSWFLRLEPKWLMFPTVTVLVTFSKIYAESMKTDREFSNLDTYRELDPLLTHGAEARPFLGVLVSPKMHLEKFRYRGAVRIHLFGVWLA